MELILGILAFCTGGGAAWRTPRMGVLFVLALLPSYLIRFSMGGIPTTWLEMMLLGVFGVWILRHKGIRQLPKLPELLGTGTALLLVAALISTVVAPDTLPAIGILKAYYLEPFLFFILIAQQFRGEKDARTLLLALTVPALAVSLGAIAQRLGLMPIPGSWQAEGRATSIYPFPNAVGLFLAPIVAACAIALWKGDKKNSIERVMFAGTALSGISAIILAKTEAASLALAVTAGMFLLKEKKTRAVGTGIIALGILVLATIPAIGGPVREKLFLQDFSGAVRRTIWRETVNFLGDHWLLGAGLSGYPNAIAPYHEAKTIEIFQYPHTIVFNIWVELGLLGLFAAMTMAAAVYMEYKNTIRPELIIAPLLVMAIHGLFDVPFFKNDLALLTSLFLALLIVLKKKPEAVR